MRPTGDASRRRRVAVVAACPFPFPRGSPARIFRTSEALARRGHEVHVVTMHLGREPDALPFEVHRTRNLPTYTRTSAGPTYQKLLLVDPLLAAKLLDVVRRVEPELIHAHHYEGLAVALCVRRLTGVPVVYDAHTLLATELGYYGLALPDGAKRRIGAWIDARLPPRADATIAVSDEIGAALAASPAATRPVHVIGNGIEDEILRRAWGPDAPDAERRLVYAGNFAPYQRTDLMLDSFARVLRHRPDVRLSVVTEQGSPAFHAEVARRGLAHAVELVEAPFEELHKHLRRALVALNPRTECAGLPQKLLNYLAAGRAVVSFAGSAKHLRSGVNARVVPDGDVGAFTEAILGLLADPERARRLGAEGRDLVRREFSWERTGERIEAVYASLLGGGAPRA